MLLFRQALGVLWPIFAVMITVMHFNNVFRALAVEAIDKCVHSFARSRCALISHETAFCVADKRITRRC